MSKEGVKNNTEKWAKQSLGHSVPWLPEERSRDLFSKGEQEKDRAPYPQDDPSALQSQVLMSQRLLKWSDHQQRKSHSVTLYDAEGSSGHHTEIGSIVKK